MPRGCPSAYITNTVKCRPPKNRNPSDAEKAACAAHLDDELATVKPRVVVCLGKHAALRMLDLPKSTSMSSLVNLSVDSLAYRAQPQHDGRPAVLVAYHPSYYLQSGRNPGIAAQSIAVLKRAVAIAGGLQ